MCILFLIIEAKSSRNLTAKDFTCISCRLHKRRKDLVVFRAEEFNLELDTVSKKLPKDVNVQKNYVRYVCKMCRNELRVLSKGNTVPKKEKYHFNVTYACTCCHDRFTLKNQVVMFKKKNYDFDNVHVKKALSDRVRHKTSMYEHICKGCHSKLRKKHTGFVEVPRNAYCLRIDSELHPKRKELSNSEQCNGQYWRNIFERMQRCVTFEQLENYVKHLQVPGLETSFKGLYQLQHDRRDYLANSDVPTDIGIDHTMLVPVHTSGAGSCLYYALSRIVYGNEFHVIEMRVRIVVEGICNMNLYLDHDYLCRGYDFPHGNGVKLPAMYLVYLHLADVPTGIGDSEIVRLYKNEMFNMRKFGCESGIWQLHQAANVLGCRLESIYPKVHGNFLTLRTDHHRLILPADLDSADKLVRIMWSKVNWSSIQYGHFVPLVMRDFNFPIHDCNFAPIGYECVREKKEVCDLTEDSTEIQRQRNISRKNDSGYFEDLEKEYDINTSNDVVMEDVSLGDDGIVGSTNEIVHENSGIGNESGFFDESSVKIDKDNCVKEEDSVYWSQIAEGIDRKKTFLCTCCHRHISKRSEVIEFQEKQYNFENDVVKHVLSDLYRCKDTNELEYICKLCQSSLTRERPIVPNVCASNTLMAKKEKLKKYCCTSCHNMFRDRQYLVLFNEGDYNFNDNVVQEVLSSKYRKKSLDGHEYICEICRRDLGGKRVQVPVRSMYSKEITSSSMYKKKREKKTTLLDKAAETFRRKCKELPEYVCTCCHRMLFLKTVYVFDRDKYKYDGVCANVLSERYRYKDSEKEEEYICQTCNKDLKANRMPAQAVANGLEVPDMPSQLKGLTRLEVRCIGLRIPFMMITALPKGKRAKIRGACVNVPATLEPIANVLPRVPENLHLVILKFKRIIISKNSYMCDFIRPSKVMSALHWLKANNPYYSHVQIDHEWLKKFEEYEEFDSVIEEKGEKSSTDRPSQEMDGQRNTDMEVGTVYEYSDQQCDVDKNNVDDCTGVSDNNSFSGGQLDEESSDQDDEKEFQEDVKESERKANITIGSTVTCMQFESPDEVAFSIAPGQNSIPKFILMDEDFEVLAFPNLFPYGKFGFNISQPRIRDLNLRRYVNQRLLNRDFRFSQSSEYIFAFQYATELKQLRTDMSMALKRQTADGRKLTAADMRNCDKVKSMIYKDVAYKFMRNVRGTPAYWQVQLYDTLAMLRTFGTPTWFLTLSPAEFMWPEFLQAVGKKIGRNWSEEDVLQMDWITKAEYFRQNPVPVDQMFQSRVESFFSDYLLSKAAPLGHITEYVQKIEFQVRGTPHAHCLLWVKDAPKVDVNSDEEVCDFIDKYINGRIPYDIPEHEDVRDLVTKLQTHRHNSCCRKGGHSSCRFNFPRSPSTQTVIARSVDVISPNYVDVNIRRTVMDKVSEAIAREDGANLKEILQSECIEEELYLNCLRSFCQRGTNIVLERDIADCNTNNYNSDILQVWRANMDIQYVADAYSCIMYVLSYVLKCENGMSEILKRVAKEFKDEAVQSQMKKVLSTFANKREVSVHEAVKRVLSQWLFRKSRLVISVSNHPKDERHRMPKNQFELADMDDDDEDVFMSSIHDYYASRPDDMEDMCLAEFASHYKKSSLRNKKAVMLKDTKLGCIAKRTTQAVIRSHRFSEDDYRFYYSKLLLFYPWRCEDQLKGEYESCQEKYIAVRDSVEKNASPYNMNYDETIERALNEYMQNESVLDQSNGSALEGESDDIVDENVGEGLQKKLQSNENEKSKKDTPLSLKYKAEALKDIMSSEEYCFMMRNLNAEQREIVIFNRMWIKESIGKMKKGEMPESYNIFLNGPGGSGKSYVIKMIHRDTVKLLRDYYIRNRGDELGGGFEDVIALITAYTGTASFHVNGMTLHSALQLGATGRGISDEKKTTLRTQLQRLNLVVIDEISMVGEKTMKEVNKRCCMIKYSDANQQNFGKINILVVGDLYQLPPVMDKPLFFKSYKDAICASDLAPSLWNNFLFHELTQVMRQKDAEFADMLNKIRVGGPEENSEVDRMLKSRELKMDEESSQYPHHALHVYAQNKGCTVRNEKMLNTLHGPLYICVAKDRLEDVKLDMSEIDLSSLQATSTSNLAHTLLLKVGARVFLSNNIDVGDGLTNGVFGTVSEIVTSQYETSSGQHVEEVRVILVKFDSERVGKAAKAHSNFKHIDRDSVPISRIECTFSTKKNAAEMNKKSIRVIRKQFPLLLAWGVTIHRVQGMTMDEIVVDMSRNLGPFQKGQAYVAFSRVKTSAGLHIINYNRHQIKADGNVQVEMERLRRDRRLPKVPDAKIWSVPEGHLRLVCLNVQGLRSRRRTKQADIYNDKEIQEADVFCAVETHFHSSDQVDAKFFWKEKQGIVYRKERNVSKGGGISVVVDKKYVSSAIEVKSPLEVVAVEIFCPNRLLLFCMYVPPTTSKVYTSKNIVDVIGSVCKKGDRVIVVGDFNEDLLKGEKKPIFEAFAKLGFKQHVTCKTTDYFSLIDHVYSRSIDEVSTDVQDTYYSDHDKVFCFLK